jgi:hypothetical protein
MSKAATGEIYRIGSVFAPADFLSKKQIFQNERLEVFISPMLAPFAFV